VKKLKKIASAPLHVVNHVRRHPGTYVMSCIALMMLLAHMATIDRTSEFLLEKGLDPNDLFLTPEDLEVWQ
jgi:hypothetical protein